MTRYVIYTHIGPGDQGLADASLTAQDRDIGFFLFEQGAEDDVLARRCDQKASPEAPCAQLHEALALCRDTGATLLVARIHRLPFAEMGWAPFFADSRLNLKVAVLPDAHEPGIIHPCPPAGGRAAFRRALRRTKPVAQPGKEPASCRPMLGGREGRADRADLPAGSGWRPDVSRHRLGAEQAGHHHCARYGLACQPSRLLQYMDRRVGEGA